ncbi:MAG: hypothetical protein ACR2QC_06640 [Gammaproteobacteria bacterium]
MRKTLAFIFAAVLMAAMTLPAAAYTYPCFIDGILRQCVDQGAYAQEQLRLQQEQLRQQEYYEQERRTDERIRRNDAFEAQNEQRSRQRMQCIQNCTYSRDAFCYSRCR